MPVPHSDSQGKTISSPTLHREEKMKKALSILGLATLLACMLTVAGSARPDTATWTGWISDSGCGAKGMSADHKACALKCVHEKGGKFVFVNSETKQVFNIHNQDAVSDSNVGMEVQLTGHLMDGGEIHVESIAAAPMQ
jgi:hypothetical protein